MNLFRYLTDPTSWAWFIGPDPHPELSALDMRDHRTDEDELASCSDCMFGGPASEADCIESQKR